MVVNNLKTAVISIVLFATASGFTYADSNDHRPYDKKMTPEQRVERQIEGMKKRLNITNEQATQISGILQEEHKTILADRQKLKDASAENKAAARLQLQQDRLVLKQKVLSNLTADQRIKVEELRKDRMKHFMHKRRMHLHEHRYWNRHHN